MSHKFNFFISGLTFLLGTHLSSSPIILSPIEQSTLRWEFSGKWISSLHDEIFLSDFRENTTARFLFSWENYSEEMVISATFKVNITSELANSSASFLKLYAYPGNPSPTATRISNSPNQLLAYTSYSYYPFPLSQTISFDVSKTIMKLQKSPESTFRFDLTAYIDGYPVILANPTLAIVTVPEQSTFILIAISLALLRKLFSK